MTEPERRLWTKDYCIPSKTEAGHALMDGILQQLEEYGWEQKDVFAIHLSIEEAIVNAIRHGNQSNNRLAVQVHVEISPARFLISIADEGEGFNPDAIPDPTLEDFLDRPCGRGVKLMRSFMTTVSFNKRGNQVTLVKTRVLPSPGPSEAK
ncbi:MAG: ATP-binding protein [Planctomycetia bacterium]|nr:ATP-binding protein [Planctomycetia bacterium]